MVDVTKEVERIRHGLLAHLRNWTEDFPEPTPGAFPADFNRTERKKMRAHVAAYLIVKDLLENQSGIEATITHLVNDASFPVTKGKHRSAVQAAVKEQYSERAKREREKECERWLSHRASLRRFDASCDPY